MFSFTKSLLSRIIRGILQGKTLFFVFILILLFSFLHATIINIPADQPSIQAGIDAAVNTDTVLVQPGTYIENINYNGKLITVGSLFLTTQDSTYISSTIIDGNSSGRVVTFTNDENSSAVLCGFTITNGLASGGYPASCGGDIKLMTAIGSFLGILGSIFTIFFSSAIAIVLLLIIKHDKRKEFPFGPFLIFSAFIYILIGRVLTFLYLDLFRFIR